MRQEKCLIWAPLNYLIIDQKYKMEKKKHSTQLTLPAFAAALTFIVKDMK